MEENNTNVVNEVPMTQESTEVVPVNAEVKEVENVPVTENASSVENPVNQGTATSDNSVEVQTEFSSADTVVSESATQEKTQVPNALPVSQDTEVVYTATGEVGTPLKKTPAEKKKVNKTLVIVIIFVVIFGGVMLLLSSGNGGNGPIVGGNGDDKIEVDVGTSWGDKYLTYMLEEHPEITEYEISFIDLKYDNTPEMLFKYTCNDGVTCLKVLYIAEDDVYETKNFKDFKIRYIYSLKDKTIYWYLYIQQDAKFGTYTQLNKIIDEMAFDSDIKATTDKQLIQYGKQYFDTDYQPTFFFISKDKYMDDYKKFIKKYDDYNKEVNELKDEVIDKYKDYVYKEEVVSVKDSVNLVGRIYKYGNYFAEIPADPESNRDSYTAVITLNNDGTIVLEGILYEYEIDADEGKLLLDRITIDLKTSNVFHFRGHDYTYYKDLK